jgi:hypothetical protein
VDQVLDPTGPQRSRRWVRRTERRGLTLSPLGRLLLLRPEGMPDAAIRLAPTLPPPPPEPGEEAGRRFLLLAIPALLLGGLLAYLLFWEIISLGVSAPSRMLLGLVAGVGPLLLLGLFLRPSMLARDRYLEALAAWDGEVRKAGSHWVCGECGEVTPPG